VSKLVARYRPSRKEGEKIQKEKREKEGRSLKGGVLRNPTLKRFLLSSEKGALRGRGTAEKEIVNTEAKKPR